MAWLASLDMANASNQPCKLPAPLFLAAATASSLASRNILFVLVASLNVNRVMAMSIAAWLLAPFDSFVFCVPCVPCFFPCVPIIVPGMPSVVPLNSNKNVALLPSRLHKARCSAVFNLRRALIFFTQTLQKSENFERCRWQAAQAMYS